MRPQRVVTRRDFLRIVGATSVAGLAALALGKNERTAASLHTVTETRLLMGTVVNLTLSTPDRHAGQLAIGACLDHMSALESVLSRYQPTSQLSRLNRAGVLEAANPHLVTVLREAARISALTDGAFDITIKPLVDLYQNSVSAGQGLPSKERITSALTRVGYQNVTIQDGVVMFSQPGMSITLDGIAKGYIVDEGTRILRQYGYHNVLVEAGGDLLASGVKAQGAPWRIGLQSPRGDNAELLLTFGVTEQAAATSGDYMQPYSDTLAVHHILDPRTGVSSTELASATVLAKSGIEADALATALMVMEPDRGLALIDSIPACEAYLVTKELRVLRSSGLA